MTGEHCRIDVDGWSEAQWSRALVEFDDANLYQTWAYSAVHWGPRRTSRLAVERDGRVIAMAQVALAQPLPPLRVGVAQVRWGPIWRRRGEPADADAASRIVDALYDEYVVRRGLHLRVLPGGSHDDDANALLAQALARRFEPATFDAGESFRTIVIDLRPELRQIRAGLDQKWRNQLNRAERNGLDVDVMETADAFDVFAPLYAQLVDRKQLVAQNLDAFRRVQSRLDARQRMKVMICKQGGRPVAGLVAATIGSTGVYLLGATDELGMKCKGAYLLQWRLIEALKQQGLPFYDLAGINPQLNPGVYHFKKGFGGREASYESPFVACASATSGLLARALNISRRLRKRPGAATSTGAAAAPK
jgi:hypothetical protein